MSHQVPELLHTILLRAMNSAHEGITISDATQADNPLIYVNEGFLKMTGYTACEVLNKNCRFLQGPHTSQKVVDQIKNALQEQVPVQVELINFHKNGTPFYNRLSITPVFNDQEALTHFIGIQEDISALKKKQHTAQQLAQQFLIHQTAIQAQEQEREIIGKELHDNINQLLATARLLLTMDTDDVAQFKQIRQESTACIEEAIEEIRKLSRTLVQPELKKQSLQESVDHLIKTMQPALPFHIEFTASINETGLSDSKKLMLYRIVQEGLNNCIKYAHPYKVIVSMFEADGYTHLLIEDDGVGFDRAGMPFGIGLRNISNRLEAEHGSLTVDTAPGNGCRLRITVPR